MSETHHIGQRLSFDGALCTVRYTGEVAGTTGAWLGVEWDDQARGKHDGSHKGTRYFTCAAKSLTAASFVRPTRRADEPQSFLSALHSKYASGEDPDAQIIIFGRKVAQEMGFDKIHRQQSKLGDLKVVVLDGLRVASARDDGEGSVRETCPNIVQLDLSRSLLETFAPIIEVSKDLDKLRKLRANGNRFRQVLEDPSLEDTHGALKSIEELLIEDTLLTWEEVCHVAGKFISLNALHAGSNQLITLPSTVEYSNLTSTLVTLNLEFNDFTTLADLSAITPLTSLRNLVLKGNPITALAPPGSSAPIFPPSIQYVDFSFNEIKDWEFVDSLTTHFPGLTGLRLTHNPVYDIPEDNAKTTSTEDAHMFTIARVASLKSLNFTTITPTDRSNAEMFYLSRIAKQLASVPESAEEEVKAQHPRYAELCDIYGEPDIIRRKEINPSFLEARLVTVGFHSDGGEKKLTKIPTSFDVYSVKGIAGKLFGLPPLKLRLIWETGEWDPVAGFYDRDGESSDDELDINEDPGDEVPVEGNDDGKPGRWVKREVELKDSPRQLGYCVDGLDATIRVEQR